MAESTKPGSANTRANGFRTVFANAFSMKVTGADGVVTFGIQTEPGNPENPMEEQVAIAMTPAGMKTVAVLLSAITEAMEKQSGTEIPLSDATKRIVSDVEKSLIAKKPAKKI